MSPLHQILDGTMQTQDAEHLRHAISCSPYMRRLLESDAALLPPLLEHLHRPWSADEMRAFLAGWEIGDETVLK